ncbi:MAG: deoxyguanosinetriphosphate triphosphohydrolase [Deltaproteobacteria bacterium]|nr:deoxyguanosinetriphosphate triphosphohydrolase [Deltaproteobacteria bacterium]
MTIRETIEKKEKQILTPGAALSSESRGRKIPEEECSIRTVYQRDRDRIIHSKAFRRLKHKTQVFLSPTGDHYRTRLTHTLEVSQIARTIARALGLNEDLTEAVALGHDLGHTPFGHAGEEVLDQIVPGGFVHNLQSLRVVDHLEKGGKGLNLTLEVRDGIEKHSKGKGEILPQDPSEKAMTLEGQVVRAADIIAYISHDLDDAIRGEVISSQDIPNYCLKVLGDRSSKRIDTMVRNLVVHSLEDRRLSMGEEVLQAMIQLREFLYARVYDLGRIHDDFIKARKVISELYQIFLEDPKLLNDYLGLSESPPEVDPQKITDFIAGMTDRYALNIYEKIFLPKPWAVL